MKTPKTARLHWVYRTFLDKGDNFRNETGRFTGSWGRRNTHGRQILGQLRSNGTQRVDIWQIGCFLRSSYLPYLIHSTLRHSLRLPSWSRVFSLKLLGRKGEWVKGSFWVFYFLINSLESISLKAASGWQNFGPLNSKVVLRTGKYVSLS